MTNPKEARRLNRAVVGFAAARGEVKVVYRWITQRRHSFAQLNSRYVRVTGISGHECQLFHLTSSSLSDFLPTVPDIHVPETREAIDILSTVSGPQHGTFAFDPDEGVLLIIWMEQGMNQVFLIRLDDFFKIDLYHFCAR